MAEQDERPGGARATSPPYGEDRHNGERVRGRPGVVAPPDPPVVPEVTDAEAAGTPPGAATRAEAPDAGPRTPQRYATSPRRQQMERPVVVGLLIALVLVLLALILL